MSDNSREILLYLLSLLETRPIFPKLYEGFREIDELAKAEDYLIDVMRYCANLCASDKLITTMGDKKLSLFEREFGLSGSGLSIDERRSQIVSYIDRNRSINDDVIDSIVKSAAGSNLVKTETDSNDLKLNIYASNTDEVTTEQLLSALKEAMIYAPQNLLIRAIHKSNLSEIFKYYHASLQKEICALGEISQESTHKILIYWGDDVQIPSHARLATPLKSRCWWIYGGDSWNNNNNHGKDGPYTPIYSDGSKTGKIPDEIKSAYSSTLSLIGEDYLILSGLCANTQSGSNASLTNGRIGTYNGCIEVYSNPTITQTVNTTLTIFEFDISDYAYPLPYLPNEIYSINGNSIIWIDNGYLSNYFEDKLLQMEYYISERLVLDELLSHQFETIN